MKKSINKTALLILLFFTSISISAQSVKIGPRLTGNLNIYNQDGLTGTWNGVGVGIGGTVDISFSKNLGLLTNLTVFDMKNFSNETSANNATTENSLSLGYLTIDPLFKAEFSGFYMLGGASVGVKISSSGERTQSATGQNPVVTTLDFETNSVKFDLAAGTGYNFKLSSSMDLGADFIAYIPLTDTFDFPGLSNSTLSLKLGASLKFRI
ncbi:MAG: outer membrane beta-barrel protein [Ignavibacteriae bacterium]|nr:outer membrane beta-barrel protein [Ignavibacteriota bacterium]MCB9208088.1 outer membrane beta-barrel protein [Ignavibacteriales bacterium]MCB9258854.1 outer membrane beta-barrel protein [Ignavibacteriales bacterium]